MTQKINKVFQQQISPWTIYDQNGKKIQHLENNLIEKRIEIKAKNQLVSKRLLNKQSEDKFAHLNNLLTQIALQKTKLNDKLNVLTSLKIIKDILHQQTNPIGNVKINLPKIKQNANKVQLQVPTKQKIRHNYYSQKINLMSDITQNALQDFSKIFISKSYHINQSNKNQSEQLIKPKFPKFQKNKSLILATLDIKPKNQFNDNSINEVIQSAKQNYRKKKNSLATLVYGYYGLPV